MLDLDEVRQYAERCPFQIANMIEELLDGLRAVGALNGQFPDRLKTMANAFFLRFRFGCGFHRV